MMGAIAAATGKRIGRSMIELMTSTVRQRLITSQWITPKKEMAIPADFLSENFSFKKVADNNTTKITFVLIKTAAVDAVVYSIPIN